MVILLVFPAASRPSINRRISFDPKILPIILEICPPIPAVLAAAAAVTLAREFEGLETSLELVAD